MKKKLIKLSTIPTKKQAERYSKYILDNPTLKATMKFDKGVLNKNTFQVLQAGQLICFPELCKKPIGKITEIKFLASGTVVKFKINKKYITLFRSRVN